MKQIKSKTKKITEQIERFEELHLNHRGHRSIDDLISIIKAQNGLLIDIVAELDRMNKVKRSYVPPPVYK